MISGQGMGGLFFHAGFQGKTGVLYTGKQ